MTAHLPALQVAVPLACAPFCLLLRSRTAAWLLFLLAERVARAGTLRYAMGGWPAPSRIESVSAFNIPVLLLVSLIAAVVAIYSRRSLADEIDARRTTLLYACLCLTLAGLLGLAITGDVSTHSCSSRSARWRPTPSSPWGAAGAPW